MLSSHRVVEQSMFVMHAAHRNEPQESDAQNSTLPLKYPLFFARLVLGLGPPFLAETWEFSLDSIETTRKKQGLPFTFITLSVEFILLRRLLIVRYFSSLFFLFIIYTFRSYPESSLFQLPLFLTFLLNK